MSKDEIIKLVAGETGLTQKDVAKVIESFFNVIGLQLNKKDIIQFIGFGSFKAKNRPSRHGVNPQTGDKIVIPAKRVVTFTPGNKLKNQVDS